MARPPKQGLVYFNIDVDFLKDIKYRKIRRACGTQTCEILLCLLGYIYGDMGYFIRWDEDSAFLVADDVGAKEGLVEEVVKKAVQVGFFDNDKFEKYKILTSNGIQKRYVMMTVKRKEASIKKEYLVNDGNNSVNDTINPPTSIDNGIDNLQRERESKVNKSKVNKKEQVETVGQSSSTDSTLKIYAYLESNGFGSPYGNVLEDNIKYWFKDLQEKGLTIEQSDAWLIHGVNTAIAQNERKWKYLDGILKNRFNKGLFSKAAIDGADEQRKAEFEKKSFSNYRNQPIRQESMPDTVTNPIPEKKLSEERQAELRRQLEELEKNE